MAVNIVVPSVGESITEGTIAQWLKKDGDAVQADEPVFELETEKATTSVAAPSSGRLVIAVPQGQTVKIGQVVGRVEEGRRAATRSRPREKDTEPARRRSSRPPPRRAPRDEVLLSPAARQHAADAGIDARQLSRHRPRRPRHQAGRGRTSWRSSRPRRRRPPGAAAPARPAPTSRPQPAARPASA